MKFKTEIKWGLIFTVSIMLWMVFERIVGLHENHIDKHATFTNFFALVAVLIYVLALRDKRANDFSGSMTWKEGFLSGVIISLVVMAFTPLTQLLTAYVISPDYFRNAIEYAVSESLATRAEAEAYFNLKNYIFVSMLSAPLMGMVTSAIVAFFLKKDSH